jgi:hypothetical protein
MGGRVELTFFIGDMRIWNTLEVLGFIFFGFRSWTFCYCISVGNLSTSHARCGINQNYQSQLRSSLRLFISILISD